MMCETIVLIPNYVDYQKKFANLIDTNCFLWYKWKYENSRGTYTLLIVNWIEFEFKIYLPLLKMGRRDT